MSKPIIALDFSSKADTLAFLQPFQTEKLAVKVGMELFYAEGASLLEAIKADGHEIFLDLKLHDIPNTVQRAMANLARLGVDMVNVHAAGGQRMMAAAKEGLIQGSTAGNVPQLIAVTQLTSTSEEEMWSDQLIKVPLLESVTHYAKTTFAAGLDGVVCSAHEAKAIGEATAANFLRVTPGIRPLSATVGDQRRIMTPAQARANGSTHIVVGRPITQADDAVAAYHAILSEWSVNNDNR